MNSKKQLQSKTKKQPQTPKQQQIKGKSKNNKSLLLPFFIFTLVFAIAQPLNSQTFNSLFQKTQEQKMFQKPQQPPALGFGGVAFGNLIPVVIAEKLEFNSDGGNNIPPKINTVDGNKNSAFYTNRITVKTKNYQQIDKQNNVLLSSDLTSIFDGIDANVVKISAPYAKHYAKFGGSFQSASIYGLERICEVVFDNEVDVFAICEELMKNENVEYAEPVPIYTTFEWKPNDPGLNLQWHLKDIDIYNAWAVAKDKTGVLVGIVDSGTDWEHQDLAANSWVNPNDSSRGWNFVGNVTLQEFLSGVVKPNNDVRPKKTGNLHGTHVAGIAAAVANNGKFGAGTGVNVKHISTKHSHDDDPYFRLIDGYKGIMYCAEKGAKVINCSWGGSGYSRAGEDVINEVLDMGVAIIAATGNDGTDNDIMAHYPSNYKGVIAVGSTKNYDDISNFTNHGYSAMLFAPGSAIYSTMPAQKFDSISGTSMASPVVAGVAALVLSVFPDYTPKQVYHQLRSTVTNIDNPKTASKLYGKINAYKAVTYNNPDFPAQIVPGVSVTKFELPPFNSFTSYRNKKLKLELTNYIGKANNLIVKVSSLDGLVNLIPEASFVLDTVGTVAMMETKNIEIEVRLDAKTAISVGKAQILVEYFDGNNFYDFEVIYVPINISTPITTAISTLQITGQKNAFNHYNTNVVINDLHYYDDNNAVAVGFYEYYYSNAPFLFLSNDGSSQTDAIQLSANNMRYPRSVFAFSNNKIAIAANTGSATSFVHLTNNLTSWQSVNVTDKVGNQLNKIHFFDNQNGILLGGVLNGRFGIGLSANGGSTWDAVNSNALGANQFESVRIFDSRPAVAIRNNSFWFGTNQGRIIFSNDRGKNWESSVIYEDALIASIAFSDNNNGMAICYPKDSPRDCYIAKTTDGGKIWTRSKFLTVNEVGNFPKYIYAAAPNTFVLVSSNNAMYATNNFGETWKNVNTKQGVASNIVAGRTTQVGGNNRIRIRNYGYSSQYNSQSTADFRHAGTLITTTITEPFFDVVRSISMQPPSMLGFGTIDLGKDSTRRILMTNTGDAVLNFSDYVIIPDNDETSAEDFRIVRRPALIGVGKQDSIVITFTPKTKGSKVAILHIANNTDLLPEIGFRLSGTALHNEFAELTVNRTEVEFDTTNIVNTAQQNITVTNIGNINLSIDSMVFVAKNTETSSADFSISSSITYPLSLSPNQNRIVPIIFNPQTGGEKNADLVIYNSGAYPELLVDITGLAVGEGSVYMQDYNIFSQVQPNPANDICYSAIYLDKSQNYTVELINSAGESLGIISQGFGNAGEEILLEIDTEKLVSGTYFLILDLSDKKYINKFIVGR